MVNIVRKDSMQTCITILTKLAYGSYFDKDGFISISGLTFINLTNPQKGVRIFFLLKHKIQNSFGKFIEDMYNGAYAKSTFLNPQ